MFIKDKDSKLRKMINRIKTRTLSDPVMKGKIINATGGRLVRFCADTGCSINLMPAKIAASNGESQTLMSHHTNLSPTRT